MPPEVPLGGGLISGITFWPPKWTNSSLCPSRVSLQSAQCQKPGNRHFCLSLTLDVPEQVRSPFFIPEWGIFLCRVQTAPWSSRYSLKRFLPTWSYISIKSAPRTSGNSSARPNPISPCHSFSVLIPGFPLPLSTLSSWREEHSKRLLQP